MQPEETGIKPWQWVVTILVIIIIIVLGIYLFKGSGSGTTPAASTAPISTSTTTAPAATNGLVVSDQFPGNIAYISSVQLNVPGFVVIKADNKGTPGAIIGTQYFSPGINPGQVSLTQSMLDGSIYYAELYADTAGTGVWNAASDQPLTDANGNPIMKIFHASSNAGANVKG